MGRSRANHSAEEDSNQSRSKRKRTASNIENLEAATSGQGISDGKKALYHCNYCNKDISGKIRIKCACCSDFDLCVECFSVGAEVYPHKSNHPYRVMDNLSFPLFCSDWNADEEILLLEGIEMYGLANWNEVAEHVGTKSKSHCIEHYNTIYMSSPCFPLPDMSHVMGKNREELLAMARGHGEVSKGHLTGGELSVKEESPFSARIKIEDLRKESPVGRPSSALASDVGGSVGGCSSASTGAGKRTSSSIVQSGDGIKVEDCHIDRSYGEKKLRTSTEDGGPSISELSGYNFKRQEFEVEYDNDAEQLLADMEFKEADTDPERELKLRVLRIYSKRLDERKRRKEFILERNLLYGDPFEQGLSPEEKEICGRYRVFMRFHKKEEHEELLKTVIEEHRIRRRIEDLQEARASGCRTSADAERYIEQKRKREAEENNNNNMRSSGSRVKDNNNNNNNIQQQQPGPSGKFLQRANHLKDSSSGGLAIPSLDEWDVTGHLGADLLSEPEKRLCSEIKVVPVHYLSMLEKLTVEVMNGHITQKSDAHRLFNVDPTKVDRVYDMLLNKGIGQP